MRRTVSVHDNCHHSVPAQSGLLRLSCFPESVGLNDHCGPQIQLKVITGATSSQTNNRVRPRPSFVIFSKIRPDDSDQHRITIREAGAWDISQTDFWMISIRTNYFWMEISGSLSSISFSDLFVILGWTNQVFYIQDFRIKIPKTSHCRLLVSRLRAIKPRIRWVDYVSICRISAIIGSCTIYLVNGDGGHWPGHAMMHQFPGPDTPAPDMS